MQSDATVNSKENGSKSNILIFYHIFCNDKTPEIVHDTVTKIMFSGLYETTSQIHCFIAGDKTIANEIEKYLKKSGPKFTISNVSYTDTSYERFTLTQIPKFIQPSDKFLYIHSKGVNHKKNDPCIYDWKNFMEYYLYKNHQLCIELLNEYDTVGVNLNKLPDMHYSGNFWWSRGDYFLRLDPIKLTQVTPKQGVHYYILPELYICTGNPKAKELMRSDVRSHYSDLYPFSKYV